MQVTAPPSPSVLPTSARALLERLFDSLRITAKRVSYSSVSHGGLEVPVAGLRVLEGLLEVGPRTVPQLAREWSTSRQNMQTIVNRLQRAGLIEMAPNPAHKRSGLFKLTDAGETVANRASQWVSGLLDYLGPKFNETELASAAKVLERLGEGIQEYGVELRREEESSTRQRTAAATAPTSAPTVEPSTDAMPVNLL